MLASLRARFTELESFQKGFLFAVMVCGFFISAEYGVSRPTSNVFFISHFSAKAFPYAWLISIPINFCVIFLYNKLLPRLGAYKIFRGFVFFVLGVSFINFWFIGKSPFLSFFHFIWKDIYILLMFKQLWSMIHATIPASSSRSFYGIIFAAGGLGSIFGSFFPGFLAVHTGSQKLFILTIPFYIVVLLAYRFAYKRSGIVGGKKAFENPSFQFSVVGKIVRSRYLSFLLLLVVFMQMSASLLDFQFGSFLEKNIQDLDFRTQYYGRVISLVNMSSTLLQVVLGTFLLNFIKPALGHCMIPLFLGCNLVLTSFFPSLSTVSYSYIGLKAVDYSFFGVLRELLYVKLPLDQKFQVKALIDVFAYRSAKALASFFLLFFPFFLSINPVSLSMGLLAIIAVSWFYIALKMAKMEKDPVPTKALDSF